MNTTPNAEFQEAILLADHVINMALVELSELDKQSIKTIQPNPEHKSDIVNLLQGIETADKSLLQVRKTVKQLISKFQRKGVVS